MAGQIDTIVAELTGEMRLAMVDVTLEVHAALVENTPVDTGNARANWICGIGDVPTAEVSDGAAQAAGIAAVLGYQVADGSTMIANNVEYLEYLINGSSTQAPAGWDLVAIESGVAAAVAKAGAR